MCLNQRNITARIIDPGIIRSHSIQRFLDWQEKVSFGRTAVPFADTSFVVWSIRSCRKSALSVLHVLCCPASKANKGGTYIKNCKVVHQPPKDYIDVELQETLKI